MCNYVCAQLCVCVRVLHTDGRISILDTSVILDGYRFWVETTNAAGGIILPGGCQVPVELKVCDAFHLLCFRTQVYQGACQTRDFLFPPYALIGSSEIE